MVSRAPSVVRTARLRSGLTQTELARRIGTTQSAVARLERADANPTIDLLERALIAADHRLEIDAKPALPPVDEAQIAEQLRMTPAQRLSSFTSAYRGIRDLAAAARASVGDPA